MYKVFQNTNYTYIIDGIHVCLFCKRIECKVSHSFKEGNHCVDKLHP